MQDFSSRKTKQNHHEHTKTPNKQQKATPNKKQEEFNSIIELAYKQL